MRITGKAFLYIGYTGEASSGESREARREARQQALYEGHEHDLLHQVAGQGYQPEQGGLIEIEKLQPCSISGKLSPQQHSLATLPLNHSLFPSFG